MVIKKDGTGREFDQRSKVTTLKALIHFMDISYSRYDYKFTTSEIRTQIINAGTVVPATKDVKRLLSTRLKRLVKDGFVRYIKYKKDGKVKVRRNEYREIVYLIDTTCFLRIQKYLKRFGVNIVYY